MSERKQTPDVLADILGAPLPIGRITDLPERPPAADRQSGQIRHNACGREINASDMGIRDRLVPGRPRLAAAVCQRAGAARLDVWATDSRLRQPAQRRRVGAGRGRVRPEHVRDERSVSNILPQIAAVVLPGAEQQQARPGAHEHSGV